MYTNVFKRGNCIGFWCPGEHRRKHFWKNLFLFYANDFAIKKILRILFSDYFNALDFKILLMHTYK